MLLICTVIMHIMHNYCQFVFKCQFNIQCINAFFKCMSTLYIFFPYRPLCVNFLPWPFAPHIFTIAVLITTCALGHMHDILTRTCSPLTFITTCCSENVPWWTSCAFFPPSVFCLVTLIAPPFILTSLDEWGSVFVCCRLEFSVWSLMGFGVWVLMASSTRTSPVRLCVWLIWLFSSTHIVQPRELVW